MAVSPRLGPTKYVRLLNPEEDSRPADVLIPQCASGTVTLVNPLQVATVERTATKASHAYQWKVRGAGEALELGVGGGQGSQEAGPGLRRTWRTY